MLLHNSFKNYFSSLTEVNDGSNRNMTGFAKIMDPEISIQRRLDYLTNDEDIVFLGANAIHEIQIFHSPRNLGGSVMRKVNKFVCLIGMGPNATCIEIDKVETSMSKVEVCTPTLDNWKVVPTLQRSKTRQKGKIQTRLLSGALSFSSSCHGVEI